MLRQILPGPDQGDDVGVAEGSMAKRRTKTNAPRFSRVAAMLLLLHHLRRIVCGPGWPACRSSNTASSQRA